MSLLATHFDTPLLPILPSWLQFTGALLTFWCASLFLHTGVHLHPLSLSPWTPATWRREEPLEFCKQSILPSPFNSDLIYKWKQGFLKSPKAARLMECTKLSDRELNSCMHAHHRMRTITHDHKSLWDQQLHQFEYLSSENGFQVQLQSIIFLGGVCP